MTPAPRPDIKIIEITTVQGSTIRVSYDPDFKQTKLTIRSKDYGNEIITDYEQLPELVDTLEYLVKVLKKQLGTNDTIDKGVY